MSTDVSKPMTEESADLKAVIDHAFKDKLVSLEVSKRIQDRADAIRARLPKTNIAVDLIRESRDDI
jgi:hypothetical protein